MKITERTLRDMVARAYGAAPLNLDNMPMGKVNDILYREGGFAKLIGAVLPSKQPEAKR